MLSKDDIIAHFGKMPDSLDEARSMIHPLVLELDSAELVKLAEVIPTHNSHSTPLYKMVLHLAQVEIAARKLLT